MPGCAYAGNTLRRAAGAIGLEHSLIELTAVSVLVSVTREKAKVKAPLDSGWSRPECPLGYRPYLVFGDRLLACKQWRVLQMIRNKLNHSSRCCRYPGVLFTSLAILAGSVALTAGARPKADAGVFLPPHASSVTKIAYPADPGATGLVSLFVTVGSTGNLDSVQTVDGPQVLRGPTMDSVMYWHFAPATQNDAGVVGTVPVDILFNPAGSVGRGNVPVGTQLDFQNKPDYVPPQLISASYASAPSKVPTDNSIVLNVRIAASGEVQDASAVTPNAPLTPAAVAAVKNWKFAPGKLHGEAVAGNVVVAFVFRPSEPPASAPVPKAKS